MMTVDGIGASRPVPPTHPRTDEGHMMTGREQLESETVDTLRKLAAAEDVDGRAKMSKTELVDALADVIDDVPADPVTPVVGDVVRPVVTLDPKLEEARDNLRKREQAETAAVEPRPTVVAIDPVLVRQRAARVAADAETRPATDSP